MKIEAFTPHAKIEAFTPHTKILAPDDEYADGGGGDEDKELKRPRMTSAPGRPGTRQTRARQHRDQVPEPESNSDSGSESNRELHAADDDDDDEQERALMAVTRDASKDCPMEWLRRIALSTQYRDTYDLNTSRTYSEWAFKVALLTADDEAVPLVALHDLLEYMRQTTEYVGLAKGVPEIVDKVKSVFEADHVRGLVPPDEESHKDVKDLPKRFALGSYVRDTSKPSSATSTSVSELSKAIYGIYHGDGRQRYTELKSGKAQPYTTHDAYKFSDLSMYREALEDMLPNISQALLNAHEGLEYAMPYTLNELGYPASTRAEIIVGCYTEARERCQVHSNVLRLN